MNVLTITTPDIENGLGCRVTLWIAGCSHHCEGCHNKHLWDYNQGTSITDSKVWNKLKEAVNHDYIAGITLCGGDPLDQDEKSLNELSTFLMKFKKEFPDKNIWIYAGDVYENILGNKSKMRILHMCDVLVDGPFVLSLYDPDLAFRGSSNQRIIDLKAALTQDEIAILDLK